MPRLNGKHRGSYKLASRQQSPGPRGNYRLATAIGILSTGRAAKELENLRKEKKKRDRKLEAVKVSLLKHRKSRRNSETSLNHNRVLNTSVRTPGRSRSRTRVTAVKGRSRSRSLSNTRRNQIRGKSRSRSRSNTRRNLVKGSKKGKRKGRLPKGLSCVSARSRSCTPERNLGLRVKPLNLSSSAMPKALPPGPVALKGTGFIHIQDKENLDPRTNIIVTSTEKTGGRFRMLASLRRKVKGTAAKVERSSSARTPERPVPLPRQRHISCSSSGFSSAASCRSSCSASSNSSYHTCNCR